MGVDGYWMVAASVPQQTQTSTHPHARSLSHTHTHTHTYCTTCTWTHTHTHIYTAHGHTWTPVSFPLSSLHSFILSLNSLSAAIPFFPPLLLCWVLNLSIISITQGEADQRCTQRRG